MSTSVLSLTSILKTISFNNEDWEGHELCMPTETTRRRSRTSKSRYSFSNLWGVLPISVPMDNDFTEMRPGLEFEETESPLLNLPVEVLAQIIGFCNQNELRELRYVHRAINTIVTPILFRQLTLRLAVVYNRYGNFASEIGYQERGFRPTEEVDNLRSLTARKVAMLQRRAPMPVLFDCVQELILEQFDLYGGYPDEESMVASYPEYGDESIQMLQDFINSMKNLKAIRWHIPLSSITEKIDLSPIARQIKDLQIVCRYEMDDEGDPKVRNCSSLTSFTNLTNLRLTSRGDDLCTLPFNYSPHLTSLTYRGFIPKQTLAAWLSSQVIPFQLRSLSVIDNIGPGNFTADLISTYFSNLQLLSLDFSGCNPKTSGNSITKFWTLMLDSNIRLKHLRVTSQELPLVEYLSSYANTLITLHLKFDYYYCCDNTDISTCEKTHKNALEFCRILWEKVVPAHASTLRSLRLSPGNLHYSDSSLPAEDRQRIDKLNNEEPWNITPEAHLAIQQCRKLEFLQLGSPRMNGVQAAVKAAAANPNIKMLKYQLRGYSRPMSFQGLCGSGMMSLMTQANIMKKEVARLSWGEQDILDEEISRRLVVHMVPLHDMWLGREEEEGLEKGMWKLKDHGALKSMRAIRYAREGGYHGDSEDWAFV